MLCRALLTAIAISYLICVLLLSGLQKDDLDVNTLEKLQRHNVNIDDMNNTNLRQECLSKPSTENINTDYDQNKTTMETYSLYKISEIDGSHVKDFGKKTLEDVMKYLMHTINNKNDKTEGTDDDQNQPNLESIAKFLKLARNNTKTQTTTDKVEIISTPKTKILGNDYVLPAKDVDYIGGFLAEYIAKKRITTTPIPSTSKNIDINSVSQQLHEYMNVDGMSPFIRSLLEQQNRDNMINFKNSDVKRHYNINLDEIINKTEKNDERENTKNNSLLISIDDIVMLKEALKNLNPFTTTEKMFNSRDSEKISYKQPVTKRSTATENGYTKSKSTNYDKQDNFISANVIKEIARTIKDIIIKYLKKEMMTEATIMASKSTTELTTTTPKPEKAKEATHVIEKIMEMFQQLKTIKESTIITANGKLKMTEKKDLKHEYTGPVKIIYPYNLMPVSPIIQQYTNTFVGRNIPQNINSMPPSYYSNPVNVKPAAITMQTNSNEIPPLGIPISKPINVMNQNIIVTTQYPRGKSEWHYRDYNFKRDKNYDEENTHRSERQKHSYIPKLSHNYDNPLNNFRGTHRGDVMSRDKPSYKDDLSNYRSRNYKTHFDDDSYYNRPRNHAIRFHEKLETNDWPKTGSKDKVNNRGGCCKIEVASRQQLPLNGIKKVPGYDDTHFNNFLKTQQKVNAMLERILATKTKFDGPHGDDRNIELP